LKKNINPNGYIFVVRPFWYCCRFLAYIAHFYYLVLIPLSLSSWTLSVEQGYRFYIIFGIAVAVCVLVSVLEELVLFSQIMKGVAEMNLTVMLVSFSVWGYILGVLGLLIYADKVLMQATVVKS